MTTARPTRTATADRTAATTRTTADRAAAATRTTHAIAPVPAPIEDGRSLRRLLAHVPTPIVAVCGMVDGRPDGMVIGSFTGVSLEPALASVCIQDTSRTWGRLRGAGRLGISVLADDQAALVPALSAKEGDRFAGVGHRTIGDAVLINGATAHFTAELVSEATHGDHIVAMLRLHGAAASGQSRPPLVFHGSALKALAE